MISVDSWRDPQKSVTDKWARVWELVGTDPVCDAENLQWIGGGFGRYGSFGEEDALVGVGGC